MTMRITLAIALISALLLPAAAFCDVKAERTEYHGWKGAWRVSNGTVDLVFVPSIGRIIRYGKVGEPNVLWENPKMTGKLPVETKDWQNFGGDKLWPAPQPIWGWPPDPELDPGSYQAKALPSGVLVVTGKASEKSGIRFEREIIMDEMGTGVRIVNRMFNSSARPVKWALWEITQVDDPDAAFIPRSPAAIHPDGYYSFPDNKPVLQRITVSDTTISIKRDHAKSAKIGTYSRPSRSSSEKHGLTFSIMVEAGGAASQDYPHGGNRQEIYTNPDPDSYVELEMLGPVREIKPGRMLQLAERWSLVQSGSPH